MASHRDQEQVAAVGGGDRLITGGLARASLNSVAYTRDTGPRPLPLQVNPFMTHVRGFQSARLSRSAKERRRDRFDIWRLRILIFVPAEASGGRLRVWNRATE